MTVTTRVSVPMTEEEREALKAAARAEMRDPRDQARYLLRQSLGLSEEQPANIKHNRGAMDSDPQRAAAVA